MERRATTLRFADPAALLAKYMCAKTLEQPPRKMIAHSAPLSGDGRDGQDKHSWGHRSETRKKKEMKPASGQQLDRPEHIGNIPIGALQIKENVRRASRSMRQPDDSNRHCLVGWRGMLLYSTFIIITSKAPAFPSLLVALE